MKTPLRIVVLTLSLFMVAVAFLRSAPTVGASPTGQIVGTVKLDGQAPHQKPIDMSKDPACSQAHGGAPVQAENVVVGANGGLANVVVYISQGLTGKLHVSMWGVCKISVITSSAVVPCSGNTRRP